MPSPNRHLTRQPARAGLVLAELLVVLLVVAVALAVLTVAATRSRSNAQLTGSLGNLKQLSAWTFQYTQDAQDLLPGFSAAGSRFTTDLIAQARQANDIIRRRGNPIFVPQTANWVPHLANIHLVLADYANLSLTDRVLASPGDSFVTDLLDREAVRPDLRHPYLSSYEFPPCFYYAGRTRDGGQLSNSGNSQYWEYNPGTSSLAALRQQPISAMSSPANKALIIEQYQWYFGLRRPFYMFREARVPIATGDGAVALRASADAAVGAYASPPPANNPISASMFHLGTPGRPGLPADLADTQMDGRLRWTYLLLAGRDFGAP